MFAATTTSVTGRGDGEVLRVDAWGPDSLRVRATLSADVTDTDYALLEPAPTTADIAIDGSQARIRNGRITAVLSSRETRDWQAGHTVHLCDIAFYDADGTLLLREIDQGGALKLRARLYRPIIGSRSHRLTALFESNANEKLVGMGLYQQALLNLKGSALELAHRNSLASVPFVVSDSGYGFLWHNPAIGQAFFGHNRTEWTAEATEQLDYWITAAGSPERIARAYADATGHAPMMPEYGLGFWQCRLRYWNQEQLLAVAREHVRRGVPLDVIVVDFFH